MDAKTAFYYISFPFRELLKLHRRQKQVRSNEYSRKKIQELWLKYEKKLVDCPVCEGRDFLEVAAADRHGLGIRTVLCNNCGFGLTNPQPPNIFFKEFYQLHYWELYFGRGSNHNDLICYWRSQSDTLVKSWISAGIDLSDKTIFEIGCGPGYSLESICAKWKCCVNALEPSIEEARRVRRLFPDAVVVNTTVESEESLPDSLRSNCDFVYSTHVFEHVSDLGMAFKLARMLVKPDGLVYIEVPDLDYEGWKYPHMFHIAHLWHFDEESLVATAQRFGLKKKYVLRGEDHCIKRSGIGIIFEVGEIKKIIPDRFEKNYDVIEKIKSRSKSQ
jgi:SAM-dependent methyltransferase